MEFKVGDKVRVIEKESNFLGDEGVVKVDNGGREHELVAVALKNDILDVRGFFPHELELVDEKREALIELAETLDKARLQANAIDVLVIQSQQGVYGMAALALTDTLEAIFEDQVDDANLFANLAYNSLLDGNTVREALAAVVK